MLSSQRALFDIPSDVAYLNAAGWSPLPRATQPAGQAAVLRKGQPWKLAPEFSNEQHERARAAAAALIGADASDVALISSVGYGVAIAGKVLSIPRGSRVLVLENDHTSPVLEWMSRATRKASRSRRLRSRRTATGPRRCWKRSSGRARRRWRSPRSPPSIGRTAGCSTCDTIRDALRRQGAALLVDATHSVGVIATDVKTLDPDFLIFPTYKWVLGPYGRAFVYVAQAPSGRRAARTDRRSGAATSKPRTRSTSPTRAISADARRYDMGERDHFISMEMAAIGMEMMAQWGAAAVVAAALRADAADRGRACGHHAVQVLDERVPRAAHPEPRISGRHAGDADPGARGAADLCRAAAWAHADLAACLQRRGGCRSLGRRRERGTEELISARCRNRPGSRVFVPAGMMPADKGDDRCNIC